MCKHAAGSNNVNGTFGYSWNGEPAGIRPLAPPTIEEGDTIIFDAPGRCGYGLDSHCYHLQVVKAQYGGLFLLCGNGTGTHRVEMSSYGPVQSSLAGMSEEARYYLLLSMWNTIREARKVAEDATRREWVNAFVQKRIKKQGRKSVRVWIEPARAAATV